MLWYWGACTGRMRFRAGCCEHHNELSSSKKCKKFLDLLRKYQLSKDCSPPPPPNLLSFSTPHKKPSHLFLTLDHPPFLAVTTYNFPFLEPHESTYPVFSSQHSIFSTIAAKVRGQFTRHLPDTYQTLSSIINSDSWQHFVRELSMCPTYTHRLSCNADNHNCTQQHSICSADWPSYIVLLLESFCEHNDPE